MHSQQTSTGWDCDIGRRNGKCESGLNGFYKAHYLYGFCCRSCNFDCCLKCLLFEITKEKIGPSAVREKKEENEGEGEGVDMGNLFGDDY